MDSYNMYLLPTFYFDHWEKFGNVNKTLELYINDSRELLNIIDICKFLIRNDKEVPLLLQRRMDKLITRLYTHGDSKVS